jgi:hypothetical protein
VTPTSPTTCTDYLIFDPSTGTPLEVDTVYTPSPPTALHLPAEPTVAAYSLLVRLDSTQNVS